MGSQEKLAPNQSESRGSLPRACFLPVTRNSTDILIWISPQAYRPFLSQSASAVAAGGSERLGVSLKSVSMAAPELTGLSLSLSFQTAQECRSPVAAEVPCALGRT